MASENDTPPESKPLTHDDDDDDEDDADMRRTLEAFVVWRATLANQEEEEDEEEEQEQEQEQEENDVNDDVEKDDGESGRSQTNELKTTSNNDASDVEPDVIGLVRNRSDSLSIFIILFY